MPRTVPSDGINALARDRTQTGERHRRDRRAHRDQSAQTAACASVSDGTGCSHSARSRRWPPSGRRRFRVVLGGPAGGGSRRGGVPGRPRTVPDRVSHEGAGWPAEGHGAAVRLASCRQPRLSGPPRLPILQRRQSRRATGTDKGSAPDPPASPNTRALPCPAGQISRDTDRLFGATTLGSLRKDMNVSAEALVNAKGDGLKAGHSMRCFSS